MKKIILFISISSFVLVGVSSCWNENKKQPDNAPVEDDTTLINYERRQTEEELRALQLEVESYGTVNNDSLTNLLDAQKEKIRLLLEELQTQKATSGKRIVELKEELGLVRQVLVSYIRQVDSLNQINKGLVAENHEVKTKYQKATQDIDSLSREKQSLTETVTKAAMLEADKFVVETQTDKGKATTKLSKIKTIAVNFAIAKNVTSQVGNKTIYARLTNPNNEVMTKSMGNVFAYEGRNIQYSMKKEIEYKGERLKDVLYWNVDETLLAGNYRIEIFADGNLIGRSSFVLK
jgi:hypothetical protein